MSDYCHRKAIRMKISEEEACKIFGVDMCPDARLDIEELLKAPFELAPTAEFFIDYNLPCSNDAEGDWGKTRALTDNEYKKYVSLFGELINHEYPILPCMLRLVEYCW